MTLFHFFFCPSLLRSVHLVPITTRICLSLKGVWNTDGNNGFLDAPKSSYVKWPRNLPWTLNDHRTNLENREKSFIEHTQRSKKFQSAKKAPRFIRCWRGLPPGCRCVQSSNEIPFSHLIGYIRMKWNRKLIINSSKLLVTRWEWFSLKNFVV